MQNMMGAQQMMGSDIAATQDVSLFLYLSKELAG